MEGSFSASFPDRSTRTDASSGTVIWISPCLVLIVMMIPAAIRPSSTAAVTDAQTHGGRRGGAMAGTSSPDRPDSSTSSGLARLDPGRDAAAGSSIMVWALSAPGLARRGVTRAGAVPPDSPPDTVCSARETSGFDPADPAAPDLKYGSNARATSPGVWNRLSGSFAIILATRAASSTGTSGRTRFSGVGVHREVGLVQVPEVVAAERRAAGQQVVERAAQAVDVGPDVGRLGVADLLGGDVVGRAQHLALAGQAAVGLALAGHLGQPEVEHLDDRLASPRGRASGWPA